MVFLGLLGLLLPWLAIRAATMAWDRQKGRALRARWWKFLCHGLDDLRCACWPGIRYERMADIWFHVALIELFAVLNATATPREKQGGGRFLVVKLAHFGDALHIFPMMRELRRQHPESTLDLLVGPWCADLARAYGIHDELLIQTPRIGLFERGGRSRRRRLWQEVRWLLGLRRREYDQVVSTSTTTLSEVLLMYALSARKWVGTHLPPGLYDPEGDASLVPYDSRIYEADRVMGLLKLLGMSTGDSDLYYPLSSAASVAADAMLRECGIPVGAKFAIICPGAGWPGKQWMPERFAEVGDRLRRQIGFSVVLIGSILEKTLCAEVARHMKEPVIQLAGRTSIDQLASILAKASLLVGNDSGPMHLAACFKIPSVLFFGPTIASKWAPSHALARCLQHEDCAGCISWHYRARCLHENRCMKAIHIDEAWQAVESVLNRPVNGKDSV